MKAKALITSLAAVFSLSGCNLSEQHQDLTAMEQVVKNAISQGLHSADSAIWGEFTSDNSTGIVCGSINIVNSQGDHSGFRNFAFMRKQNTIFWEESEKFEKMVNDMCANLETYNGTVAANSITNIPQ